MNNIIANQICPSQVSGRLAMLHRVLEEADLPYDALQLPIDDKEMRARLVRFWINGGYEPSTSQKRAREIMGTNFFGIEEALRHFGVKSNRRQLAALSEIPFSEAVLEQCKNTHVLVAPMLSIVEVRDKLQGTKLLCHQPHYDNQLFANEKEFYWQLVSKTEVPNSAGKNWRAQQALLGKDDEVPTAQVMIYTVIGHYLVTGVRLFDGVCVRTSSVNADKDIVQIAFFYCDDSSSYINSHFAGFSSNDLSIAVARRI